MRHFLLITLLLTSSFAFSQTKAKAQRARLPIGTIVPYAGQVDEVNKSVLEKDGWLVCDGAAISRDKYKALFKVIGSIHGRGDGIKTFNLPDYRGRFLRGVSEDSGRDPDAAERKPATTGGFSGNKVGSIQEDELRRHRHIFTRTEPNGSGCGFEGCNSKIDYVKRQSEPTGGNETRPKNVNVYYLIFCGD